jgi:predicted ATPase
MDSLMLKIRKLKIDIQTIQNKRFGAFYKFEPNKLNLIKGNNHSGKTTIVSSLFYALGMEELIGGQNTKALDSILTSVVKDKGEEYLINESVIYLEIENKNNKIITIKRYVKHVDIQPKIAYIYENSLDELSDEEYSEITYIHDGGSAQNSLGFYKYLENYIGYSLPKVPSYNGGEVKLYLQIIFNAYFVEQLKGWTDFFASIPSFGIKDPKQRIIEFLLNLEASEFEKDKFKYEEEKERINKKWLEFISQIEMKTEQVSAQVNIEYLEPVSIDKFRESKIDIYFIDEENQKTTIDDILNNIRNRVVELYIQLQKPNDEQKTKRLFQIRKTIQSIARKISKLNQIIDIKNYELIKLKNDFSNMEEEIRKLTDLKKIETYINSSDRISQTLKGICSTCKQPIDSSFYSSKIDNIMSVDENKKYLEGQKKVLKVYIEASIEEIEKQKEIVIFLEQEYAERQSIINYLEKDIALNTNMSVYKEVVNLESKEKFYKKTIKDISMQKEGLLELSEEWKKNEMQKTTYEMSLSDNQKITSLERYFTSYLYDFGYGSKDSEQIKISKQKFERYFPIVKIEGRNEKIRINSSASDFVRSLWAYYIGLFEVSKKYRGNHIGLFIFDEPAQHAMNESSQKAFLERLSKLDGCQSIVFSSFEDKDDNELGKEKFKNMIKDIDKFNIHTIEIDGYSIKKIRQ